MSREFDAVVFGASGFTGQYVVEEMAISMNMDSLYKRDNLKWAVAGRNKDKIIKVLQEVAEQTGLDSCNHVPIIEADTADYNSLVEMCKRTRLIITTVGPYKLFGEPLVKACIQAGSDYVDVSGEPSFLEGMQLKYYEEAKRKGVYIVGAAGWDSIPADFGTTWTKQQFQGDLDSVEIIISMNNSENGGGPQLNFGTWHSAIYGIAQWGQLGPVREKLYRDVLPLPPTRSPFPLKRRPLLTYIDEAKGYCLPFLGSDKTVVKRSEIYKYHNKKERPVHCETYFRCGSMFAGIMIVLCATMIGGFAKFACGRYLLKKYPRFFSFGFVSKEGVPRSVLEKRSFTHTIIGYGWDEKFEDPDRQHDTPPTKKIVSRVSGPDAGYIGTSALVVHAGMTLLFDRQKLPAPGVLTPGACFRDTYILDRLSERNIKLEVLERF